MSSPEPQDRPSDAGASEEKPDRLGARARRLLSPGRGAEERLDAFLEEMRHELDEHTARFHERLAEIERRETALRDTRLSIERLLRLGTRDLDAQESDLTRLGLELSEREARLDEAEAELTRRRGELGAVELKRVAAEQRERALAVREARLDERKETSEATSETTPTAATALLVFVPGTAYRLVEIEHEPLEAGETLEIEGEQYVVARSGPSPFPGDVRRCAYLTRGSRGASPSDGSS